MRYVFGKADKDWNTFEKVVTLLSDRYAERLSDVEIFGKLIELRQSLTESIEEYAQRFEEVLEMGQPMSEAVKVELFRNGLRDVDAKIFIIE